MGPVYQILHDFLVVHDNQGRAIPHLAEARPSMDDGTWKVFPDGTMETIWRLRRGVKWHDGVEATGDDIAFAWQVANDPQVPWARRTVAQAVDSVTTPDAFTVVMHWKSSFPFADDMDETALDPVPRHILGAARESGADAFTNALYWTREFVGLGPYRLLRWEPGSHMDLRAVDGYFLGRARIAEVTVRFVTDPNAMMANLLAGSLDVNMPQTDLTFRHWKTLQDQWRDGEVIFNKHGTLGFVGPNLRVPPLGDVRVRRAMTHAIDREAVGDALLVPRELIADTFLVPGSDKAARLQGKVHVYAYDPARGRALLDEAGWRRGADGLARNVAGQALELDLRSSDASRAEVIANLWKAVGIQANIVISPPALATNLEYQADVKGLEISGYPVNFSVWQRRVHSLAIPRPQTRWAGLNRTYYENSEVDALIDRFSITLGEEEREAIEGEIFERVTRDDVFYPLFINAGASAVRKGIRGFTPMVGTPRVGSFYQNTWNITEWDRP
jgi:peptide/nickel transport system substrate-binding protein